MPMVMYAAISNSGIATEWPEERCDETQILESRYGAEKNEKQKDRYDCNLLHVSNTIVQCAKTENFDTSVGRMSKNPRNNVEN